MVHLLASHIYEIPRWMGDACTSKHAQSPLQVAGRLCHHRNTVLTTLSLQALIRFGHPDISRLSNVALRVFSEDMKNEVLQSNEEWLDEHHSTSQASFAGYLVN